VTVDERPRNAAKAFRQALREEFESACQDARPPAAGVVWFRAERRRREEAVRTATRPFTVVHAISGACAVGVAAALLQLLAPWLRQRISGWGIKAVESAAADLVLPRLDMAAVLAAPITWLAAGAVLSLVAGSIAVYVALLHE
jgi:hypothetical protein